jgi:hypothetical protein
MLHSDQELQCDHLTPVIRVTFFNCRCENSKTCSSKFLASVAGMLAVKSLAGHIVPEVLGRVLNPIKKMGIVFCYKK